MSSAEMTFDAVMPPPTGAVGFSRGSLLVGAVGAASTEVGGLLVCDGDDCEHAASKTTVNRTMPAARISTRLFMPSSHDSTECLTVGLDGLLGNAPVRVAAEHPR